jgi:predicted amidohydrolase YtcJ
VNRTTREGKLLGPEEQVSDLEALKTYINTAHYCSLEEKKKSSIEVRKLVDFVMLSDNPPAVAPRPNYEY